MTQTVALPLTARFYYGWTIVGVAALAMVGTLPGRTQGLGLITEPLLVDLGISRIQYAQINLVATLVGALGAVGVGRLVDRRGSRPVLTAIALLLGTVVLAMGLVTNAVLLLVMVTLSRGLGQTALSIVSLAMIGKWFHRRLTRAMAVYSVALSVGFMLAFPAVGALVLSAGWRVAWSAVGTALIVVLAPAAWLLVRSTPEEMGERVDGVGQVGGREGTTAGTEAERADDRRQGATLATALRTPVFWVFATASAMYGLVASGIGLFNEAILRERGFQPDVYHTALAITAVTGLLGNFGAGWWAERGSLRAVLATAMFVLGTALAALPRVSSTTEVFAQAVAMGIAGGLVMVVFFSSFGRAFGDRHLGQIQGAAQALTVVASALGPLALASSVEMTGSYAFAFHVLAALVIALGLAAMTTVVPAHGVAVSPPTRPSPR